MESGCKPTLSSYASLSRISLDRGEIMGFWQKLFQHHDAEQTSEQQESAVDSRGRREMDKADSRLGSVTAGMETAQHVRAVVEQKFSVPDTYTGNRSLYDNGYAKLSAKQRLFQEGCLVQDPYTGDQLVLTKQEAKLLYGEDWTRHLAESDHIKALEKVFAETKDNPWLTNEDRRAVANSPDNIQVTSRKYNNAKRSRTNEEFVQDADYRRKTGVKLKKGGGQRAIRDEEQATASIDRQFRHRSITNMISTGHEAGLQVGASAGMTAASIATIQNIVQVIEGRKKADEAIRDVVVAGGQAAATGYVMGGGLTVLSQTLSRSSSGFIRGLVKSNMPGLVVTSCIAFGGTLNRYASGKISTEACLTELGASGLQMGTVGYTMGVGQAVIPIPVVGAAVGAAVGAVMSGALYHTLLGCVGDPPEIRQRNEVIRRCREAAEAARTYRQELQAHMDAYFADYGQCFDEALADIRFSFAAGDADGVIRGANQITRKVGGTVKYESVEEFKQFLDDGEEDFF